MLLEEWILRSLVTVFRGKGDPLNPNSYRGIKLLEYAFKLREGLDGRLRKVVDIDKMQYGFMPGRGTIDPVFVLRRFVKNSEPKISCFFYLLTWKMRLIGCQGNLFILL